MLLKHKNKQKKLALSRTNETTKPWFCRLLRHRPWNGAARARHEAHMPCVRRRFDTKSECTRQQSAV